MQYRNSDCAGRTGRLTNQYNGVSGVELIRPFIENEFRGRIAVISSFGTEAAVLLDLVAAIDLATPIIFLDTGNHFAETLAYRDKLVARLGLADVRSIIPDNEILRCEDARGDLWRYDNDRCCRLRRVLPLHKALNGFDACFTGRKRYHGNERACLPVIETSGARVKINPLANWSQADIDNWMTERDLPRHPLGSLGYLSIGCEPCTEVTTSHATPRDGRWVGTDKTECGIHHARCAR